MSDSTVVVSAPRAGLAATLKQNWAFVLAVVLLALTMVGIRMENWVEKEAVPWSQTVKVDHDYRMLSMPETVGSLVAIRYNDPNEALTEELVKALGMGVGRDPERLSQRKSNWYAIQRYVDKRNQQVWQMELFYYTGIDDKVPHVPERCLAAAGAKVLGSDSLEWNLGASAAPWPEKVPIRRTRYLTQASSGERVSYYTFSLNGKPENDWRMIRAYLAKPWVRYCYFAKIQIYPVGIITSTAAVDAAAQDVLRQCLPELLKLLPSAADVEALSSRPASDKGK